MQKEKQNDKMLRLLELILDVIETDIVFDPKNLNCPHFYSKKYLKFKLIIRKSVSTKSIPIYFNREKTLCDLKEKISQIEKADIKFIQFEDYSISYESKTLNECGIKNNDEIKIFINSFMKNQTENSNQNTTAYYFLQTKIHDKLFNVLNKNELYINSIAWKILQLLPTDQSIYNMIIEMQNESNVDEKFNKLISETENKYQKLYIFLTFGKFINMFVNQDAINILIDLFQEDFLKDEIIHILNSLYNDEEFQQCKNVSSMLINYINNADDDEIISIIQLLVKMSKSNKLNSIINYIDKFENLNEKHFDMIGDLFYNTIQKNKKANKLLEYIESKIKNDFGKSKLSLIVLNKIIEFIIEPQIIPIYQYIIEILSNYIDIFYKQNNISELEFISDIFEFVSNILAKYPTLIKESNFPINFFVIISFDPRFKLMQKNILSIISIYIKTVKNQEVYNDIISNINEIIINSPNNWNYDPLLNNKIESYTGIKNLGATSYINSIFQQIYHLFPVRYFLSTKKFKSQKDLRELQKIIIEMAYTKRPFIDISEFISKWKGWKNEYLNPKEQHDSIELFHYLIESFPTKIKNLFKGEIMHYINNDVTSNEAFYYLSIPVKDHADIYSSLNDFYKNDNKFILSKISQLPSIFVIQLNRFENENELNSINKVNYKFEFPIELNIDKMCTLENKNECLYQLNGVILRRGSSNSSHYISLIKKENDFICFNDKNVTRISNDEAFNLACGTKEIDTSAYILFYTKTSEKITIKNKKAISFNEEFDIRDEINSNKLKSILNDNESYEKNQMIFGKYIMNFINEIENPLLNISFFIRILCHSTNYQQSELFITNLKKLIREEFNSIDSSPLFGECADYMINNSDEIVNCFLNCKYSSLLSNLSNFIEFFFNYYDKIMALPENIILIDDDNDFDASKFYSQEKSLVFFKNIIKHVINQKDSVDKVLYMTNFIISYFSNHMQEAYDIGLLEYLITMIDNIYGSKMKSKQIDFSNLDISDILNILNLLLIKYDDPESNLVNIILKFGDEIKLSKKNIEPYKKLVNGSIIPAIDLINEMNEYLELEKISPNDYLWLIKSLNLSQSDDKIPNYSLLVYPKQRELLVYVAKHDIDSCIILLKANVSKFKKSVDLSDFQTSIEKIDIPNKNLFAYCVKIPEIGEILIAENGNILLNNLTFHHSLLVKTSDEVFINSGDNGELYIDTKNVIILNENECPTKIQSLIIKSNNNESKLNIPHKNILRVDNLISQGILIMNFGSLIINNDNILNNCSIINNGYIKTEKIENIKFLLNTSSGCIENDDNLILNAVNINNFGVIRCNSIKLITDIGLYNYQNIISQHSLEIYSKIIENYGNYETKNIFFAGDNLIFYPESNITAHKCTFINKKIEFNGKIKINDFHFVNETNKKINNIIAFNNTNIENINEINIGKNCQVMLGEKTTISKIKQILNEGEFILQCNVNEINIILNKGHIILYDVKNEGKNCILYTGNKHQDINSAIINVESKYVGEENSIFEIVDCCSMYISQFISRGKIYCHHSLSIIQNFSDFQSVYGLVVAQNEMTFFNEGDKIFFDQKLIDPILEGNDKIFILKSHSKVIITTDFNKKLSLFLQTQDLINRSCLIINDITINACDFNNFGKILSSNDVDIKCFSFTNNGGRIEAHRNININANKYLINKGGELLKKYFTENIKIFHMIECDIHMDKATNLYSTVKLIEKNITVTKDRYQIQIDKCGVITTDKGVLKMCSETIDNSFGIISSNNGIFINGDLKVINEYGLIYSGDYLKIISNQFKNGYRKESEVTNSYDPNRPIIAKGKLVFKSIDHFNDYKGKKQFLHYLEKKDGYSKVLSIADFISGYQKSPITHENQGYLFAQNDINIFSDTDVCLGTIVSRKNISVKGKSISSINFLDRGKLIANGDVFIEMKHCSIDQARIQANNIAIKLMENLTINEFLHPVFLLDGSSVLILDLKQFAQFIGIFNKYPEMGHKMLDITEYSLKKRDSSGFIGEQPSIENFISSLPDKKMRDIIDFILTPNNGRHILQNENLIQSLEYSGATSDSNQFHKTDKPMILYKKSSEKQVIYDDKGKKQYISVYDPQLIINTLNKVVSFLDAQDKISIQTEKSITINSGTFEVNSNLSLEAGEKISLLSKMFYGVNQVNIQSDHELTISGKKGVDTQAVKINSQKINIVSTDGDVKDEALSLNPSGQKDITSEIYARDKISLKGKKIKLLGTNIFAGSGGIKLTAKNIDIRPVYETICIENKHGRTDTNHILNLIQPQKIKTVGNINFDAKNVNILSSKIYANAIKNNIDGNFNISAIYDHEYYHSYYCRKKMFFGKCISEQREINDLIRPTEIVAKEIQSFGVGMFKIESAIIKATNMFISKNIIENTLENEYSCNTVCKRKGFFPPTLKVDKIKKSYTLLKDSLCVDSLSDLVKDANCHIKTLTNLSSSANPTVDFSAILLSRFTTSAVYSNIKTTFNQQFKVPVQSNVKLGLLIFNNNQTHLKGIWEIDKASIETDKFIAKSSKQIEGTNSEEKGFQIIFNPARMLTRIFYSCSLVSAIIPTMNIIKKKDSITKENNYPILINANDLLIRCNDAIFSGSQIRSKVVDAIVNGKLNVESLTNIFERKIKNTNIEMDINSLYNYVLNEKIPETLFEKLHLLPSIRVANKKVLEKKVDALAQIIGTEYFYLKVAEFFYSQPDIIELVKEGSYVINGNENEILRIRKKESKSSNEEYHEKNKIIDPSIQEIINIMGQSDDNKRFHSDTIKTVLNKRMKVEEISKIDNRIRDFFNDDEYIQCIQELNKNIKKFNELINSISNILYDFPDEKSMPKEISTMYHEFSNKINKQIPSLLQNGTIIVQKYEKFRKNNSDIKEIYENSISYVSNNIIDGLIEVPMIFCKDSLYKYQRRFSKICKSKNMKCNLIEQFPDKIIDYVISHATNEKEAIEFSKTMIYGFKNINKQSNEWSYNIKNPEIYIQKLDSITENIKKIIDKDFIHKEELRNESIQSISEFLNQEVLKTIKFFLT